MPRRIPSHSTSGPPAEALVGETAELLHAVSHRMRREARHELEPLDITWAQLRALRTLQHRCDVHDRTCGDDSTPGIRMSDLADALDVARRSATSLVDELTERRLVERLDDPADRRSVRVVTTEAGRALLDEAGRRRHEAAGRVLGALPSAQLQTLHDLLAHLVR